MMKNIADRNKFASKLFIALYKPIIPSCTISSLSAPIIKNLLAFILTTSSYLFIKHSNALVSFCSIFSINFSSIYLILIGGTIGLITNCIFNARKKVNE